MPETDPPTPRSDRKADPTDPGTQGFDAQRILVWGLVLVAVFVLILAAVT